MPRSISLPRDVTCPACRHAFTFDNWFFVDCHDRPDLVVRITEGTLFAVACPSCGHDLGILDGFFVLMGLGGPLPVLMTLPTTTPQEENKEFVLQLGMEVQERFGADLPHDWMSRLQVVGHQLLRVMLTQWTPDASEPFANLRVAGLLAFVCGNAGRDRRALIGEFPEILDDASLAMMDRLVAAAKASGVAGLVKDLELDNNLLRRCAREGVERALPEDLKAIIEELDELSPEDMERGIHLARLAISYGDAGRDLAGVLDWEKCHDRLAMLLLTRERPEDFEEIIDLLEGRERESSHSLIQQISLPEHWANRQSFLAMAYRNRSLLGEREYNFERAIEHYDRALKVWTSESEPDRWAAIQIELIGTYAFRISGDSEENFATALACADSALQVFSRESHPGEWFHIQLGLGRCYLAHRKESDHAGRVDRAIEHLEQALEICDRGANPKPWATCHVELSIAYRNRTHATDWDASITAAIEHLQAAHEVLTRETDPDGWASTHHRLGDAFGARPQGERSANEASAIEHLRLALEVRTLEHNPTSHSETQEELADLHFRRSEWRLAHTGYKAALSVDEERFAGTYTERARVRRLEALSALYARVAHCLIQLGSPGEALGYLEAGRARLLSQELTIDDMDLSILSEDVRSNLNRAHEDVALLESEMRRPSTRRRTLTSADRLRTARRQLHVQIHGAMVAHPELYPQPRGAELLAIAPHGGAVVAYLVTSMGATALVFRDSTTALEQRHCVSLSDVTDRALLELVAGDLSDATWLGAYQTAAESGDHTAFTNVIEQLNDKLWPVVVGPVFSTLQELGTPPGAPVVILPHNLLSLLPLHAVGRKVNGEHRTFGDEYVISYAPSLLTLAAAQRRARIRNQNAPSLLAVVDPTGDLPFAKPEVDAVARLFDPQARTMLSGNEATQEAVAARIGDHSFLHFACHGTYDWGDVMQSGLVLAGEDVLTLAEVVSDLTLGVTRLVTLSACETGISDLQTAPDEYISLAAGFLRAGAPAVLATLWPVEDFATTLFMEEFYRRLITEKEPIARALTGAAAWLRELGRDDALARAERARDAAAAVEAHLHANYIQQEIEYLRDVKAVDGRSSVAPFSSPFFWAAFVAVGAA